MDSKLPATPASSSTLASCKNVASAVSGGNCSRAAVSPASSVPNTARTARRQGDAQRHPGSGAAPGAERECARNRGGESGAGRLVGRLARGGRRVLRRVGRQHATGNGAGPAEEFAARAGVAPRAGLRVQPPEQPARGPGNGVPDIDRKEVTQHMSYTAFQALVRRDLRLFFQDKRAVTMSFVAPIAIAAFFGYIFGGVADDRPASKIALSVVNQDDSEVSRKVIAALAADAALDVKSRGLEEARELVRGGKTTVAAVIPPGFAERAGKSFFRGGDKPEIQLLYDPSHATEVQVVRGVLMQHVMEIVSRETMGGPGSERVLDDALRDLDQSRGMKPADQAALRRMLQGVGEWNQRRNANPQAQANAGFSMPYTVITEAVTARQGVKYNSMAHSFAGMCVQFILFMGIDAGMVVLYQRRSGLWKRLQAAPLSRYVIIGSRATSAGIVAMAIMLVVFGFARVVFGVKIEGSLAGFLGVCVAFAIMTATFGLLIAD